MKDVLINALKAMNDDSGTVLFTFSNGASTVYIDIMDSNGSHIGGNRSGNANCIAYVEANADHIKEVV